MRCLLLILCAAGSLLAGCVATAPEWEARFGDAVRQSRAAQVIDPAAPSRNTAVPALDGKAAVGVQTTYAQRYGYGVKSPALPAIQISVPSQGSAQQ